MPFSMSILWANGYQGRCCDRDVIVEDDRRFFMAEIGDRHLAKITLVALQPDTLHPAPSGSGTCGQSH